MKRGDALLEGLMRDVSFYAAEGDYAMRVATEYPGLCEAIKKAGHEPVLRPCTHEKDARCVPLDVMCHRDSCRGYTPEPSIPSLPHLHLSDKARR